MVVVLVGFMGAGKTTVGRIMAERLGQPFVDSDVLIEQRHGREIRDIFRTEGEPYFRQLEHDTVAGLVRGPDAVIALGGGAVEDPRSRAVLRNARVVYLRVSYDEAMARVKSDEFRPMLHRPDLDEVYKRRLSAYEDISVLTVDTDGRRPDAVALEVLARLTRLPATPPVNRVAASLAAQDTDGCLRELDRLAPRIGLAEVRLDLMRSFDVAKLVASSPVPLILTCRPEREHGGFTGHDSERMRILRTAHDSGCAYIDVEADCLHLVTGWGGGSPTQVIASQHWFDAMPPDLLGAYRDLRDRCAVVKLVGTARSAADVLPVLGAPAERHHAGRRPGHGRAGHLHPHPGPRLPAHPAHLRRRHPRRGHRPRPDHRGRDDRPLRPPPRHPGHQGLRPRHPARRRPIRPAAGRTRRRAPRPPPRRRPRRPLAPASERPSPSRSCDAGVRSRRGRLRRRRCRGG